MARSIPKQMRTQADDLRDLLETSYKQAVSLRGAGAEQARDLLYRLDRIQELFPELEALGVDLRAERGRWEEVQGAVRRHAGDLRSELAPLGGLKTLREALPEAPDPEERWWWWLDVTARKHLGKKVLVTLVVAAGILLVMLGGLWAFNKFFPVDPNVSIAYEHKSNAENLVLEGKYQEAIDELEAARQAQPDDLDVLTMLAALYDLTGEEDAATPVLRKLFETYPQAVVHAGMAQAYAAAGDARKAQALARMAIEEDPANPQGWLVSGMAYEAEGDVQSAMNAYQKAAEVANAARDYQTEAFAKVRLATLLQKPQLPAPAEEATTQPGG